MADLLSLLSTHPPYFPPLMIPNKFTIIIHFFPSSSLSPKESKYYNSTAYPQWATDHYQPAADRQRNVLGVGDAGSRVDFWISSLLRVSLWANAA